MKMEIERCPWSESSDILRTYHDEEWGVSVIDDGKQFEFLTLETFQAGLSWLIVLRKREHFREAFAGFDPKQVSCFGEAKVRELVETPQIIRNRAKIEATITNARAFLELAAHFGSFSNYLWAFVEGRPIVNRWRHMQEIPAKTALAEKISKDLRQRGFRFVGPTVLYSHMQATGLVNDHLLTCFRYKHCAGCSR
jgi:DNA-3-methyladenine glycosylase I